MAILGEFPQEVAVLCVHRRFLLHQPGQVSQWWGKEGEVKTGAEGCGRGWNLQQWVMLDLIPSFSSLPAILAPDTELELFRGDLFPSDRLMEG